MDKDLTFCANNIAVYGFFEVGTEQYPFNHSATIMLHGVDTDPVLVMTEGLFMHNKVMGVVQGRLDLHGKPTATPASRWKRARSRRLPHRPRRPPSRWTPRW